MAKTSFTFTCLVFYREVGSTEILNFRVNVSRTRTGIASVVAECDRRGFVFLGIVPLSYAAEFYNSLKQYIYE